MKKLFAFLFFAGILFAACGTKNSENKNPNQMSKAQLEQVNEIKKLDKESENIAKEVDDLLKEINDL